MVKARTNIALNFIGHSLLSLHYEYQAPGGKNTFLTLSSGVGYQEEFKLNLWIEEKPNKYITIPNQMSLNIGNYKHSAELALGLLTVIGNTSKPFKPYVALGYRMQTRIESGRPTFRIYMAYPFGGCYLCDITFLPFGLSIGFFL